MSTTTLRKIRIDGDVAYVPLTQGYEAIIDVADVPLVDGRNWLAHKKKGEKTYYARCKSLGRVRQAILMHRVILGAPKGVFVDHADGNGLNNRRSNIRLASASHNNCNRSIGKNNTSGFKGVSRVRGKDKWQAQIAFQRKRIHLGWFLSPEEAHAAYVRASAEMHGSFARPK